MNIFQKKHVKFNDLDLHHFQILDRCHDQVFLNSDELKKAVLDLFYCKGFGDDLRRKNVVFHLHDDAWLVKYYNNIVNTVKVPYHAKKGSEFAPDRVHQLSMSIDSIKKYVKYAPSFKQRRNQFESDLVKAYVDACLRGEQMMTMTPHKFIFAKDDYDEVFRENVVAAMEQIGINPHSVEAILETNADLWRKKAMKKAFIHQNYFVTEAERTTLAERNPELYRTLKNHENNNFKYWVRLREYDYYQKHQAIVDEMGTATENMKMNVQKRDDLAVKEKVLNHRYQETLIQGSDYLRHERKQQNQNQTIDDLLVADLMAQR